jgi:hypothetical protein
MIMTTDHVNGIEPIWMYFARMLTRFGPNAPVKIQRCGDPQMWYAKRVGELIPIEKVDKDGLWAREPSGYINIIHFEDVLP